MCPLQEHWWAGSLSAPAGGGGHVLALVEGGERGRTSGVREQIHKAHTGDKGRSKLRSQGCVRRSLLSGI